MAVKQMESQLFAWYASESQAGREHTRVQSLVASLFGTADAPRCKYHGAETNGLLDFAAHVLAKHEGLVPN
eukprot:14155036-Alexandrium_andersonii.AAC.1